MHRNSSLSCYSILKIAKIAKKIRKPPFSGLFDFQFSKVVDILKKKRILISDLQKKGEFSPKNKK